MDEGRERLRASLLEAVDNQIRDGESAAAGEAYKRLQREGYPPDEAKNFIASVLVAELFDISTQNEPFNEARYVERLERLPELPWDDEEDDV